MRALIAAGTAVAVVAVLVLLVRFNVRAWSREKPAAWTPQHRTVGETTTVSVELRRRGGRALDSQPIALLPVAAADYEDRFLEAMSRARDRAAVLQSEIDALPR